MDREFLFSSHALASMISDPARANEPLAEKISASGIFTEHLSNSWVVVVDRAILHSGLGHQLPHGTANGEAWVALTRGEFADLIHEHAAALYAIAYRMVGECHDAEDVVQETLRSAWTCRERFEQGRGQRAWLATILRRRVMDRWRRVGRRFVVATDGLIDVAIHGIDPTADGYTDEMQHALAALPDELRESLLLVVVGELTHQETADALGVPLGTVLSRVSRARQRLRKDLRSASLTKR